MKPLDAFRVRRGKPISRCRECESARARAYRIEHPEKPRGSRAEYARKRRADPAKHAAHREVARRWYREKGAERERTYHQRMRVERPWHWRVRRLRSNISNQITEAWLRSKWDEQAGCCALSGLPLEIETLEVDHIIPRSRGGSDDLANLRLVCRAANAAKGNLLDDELFDLCRAILRTEAALAAIYGRAAA